MGRGATLNSFLVISLSDQDRQNQCDQEKGGPKVGSSLLQDVGGLGPEHLIRHARAERCPQSLLLRALHENHQDEETAHHYKGNEQKVDQNIHGNRKMRGGTMVPLPMLVKHVPSPVPRTA